MNICQANLDDNSWFQDSAGKQELQYNSVSWQF